MNNEVMGYSDELQKAQNTINTLIAKNKELVERCERLEKIKDEYRMEKDKLMCECHALKKELDHVGSIDVRGENSRLRNCVIGLCIERYCKELGL